MTESTTPQTEQLLTPEQVAEAEHLFSEATPGPLGARLGSGQNVCTALASEAENAFDEFVCDVLPDYACQPGTATRWEANRNLIEWLYANGPALCRTLKAAWANTAAHREAMEAYKAVIDQRESENVALREQLARLRNALEPLSQNGRLFTFHRNVEEGDYFECGICTQEAKKWNEIQHTPHCKIAIAKKALEVGP